MTLYLGIDESIVLVRKREQAFIYVGTFTKDHSQGEERSGMSKIRNLNNANRDLEGLAGFLFGVFLFNNQRKKDIDIQQQPNKNYQQFLSVNTLIKEGLGGAEKLGILEIGENIKIEIDGHDTYRIGKSLNFALEKTKYSGRFNINFIAHGDQKIKIINHADKIAYILRNLKGIEEGIDSNLGERGLEALLNEQNPQAIKKITPYHLEYPFKYAA